MAEETPEVKQPQRFSRRRFLKVGATVLGTLGLSALIKKDALAQGLFDPHPYPTATPTAISAEQQTDFRPQQSIPNPYGATPQPVESSKTAAEGPKVPAPDRSAELSPQPEIPPILVDLTNPKRDPAEVIKYNDTQALQVVLPKNVLDGDIEVDADLPFHSVVAMSPFQYYTEVRGMTDEDFRRLENEQLSNSIFITPNPDSKADVWRDGEKLKIRIFNPNNPKAKSLTIPIQVETPHGIG